MSVRLVWAAGVYVSMTGAGVSVCVIGGVCVICGAGACVRAVGVCVTVGNGVCAVGVCAEVGVCMCVIGVCGAGFDVAVLLSPTAAT